MNYKFYRIASVTLLLCCCILNNSAMCSQTIRVEDTRYRDKNNSGKRGYNASSNNSRWHRTNTKYSENSSQIRERNRDRSRSESRKDKYKLQQQDIREIVTRVMKSVLDKDNNNKIFGSLTKEQIKTEYIAQKLTEIANNNNNGQKIVNNIKPVTNNSTQNSENNIANNPPKSEIYNKITTFLPDSVKKKLCDLKQYKKNSDEYTNFVNELSDTLKNIIEYGTEIYNQNKRMLSSFNEIFNYFKENSRYYYDCTKLIEYEKRIMLPIINTKKFSETYFMCMESNDNNTNNSGNMAFCVLEFVDTINEKKAYAIVGIDKTHISMFADSHVDNNNSITEEYTLSEYDNNYIKNILTPPKKHMEDYMKYEHSDYYHSKNTLDIMKYNNFTAWYFPYRYQNLTKYNVNYFKVKLHETIDKSDKNKCNFHNFAQDKEYKILLNILNNKKILYNVIQKYFNEKTTNVQLNIHLFTSLAMCPACWTVWHKYINGLNEKKFLGNIKINEFNVYAREEYNSKSEPIHPLFLYAKEDSSNNNKNQNEISQKIQINQYHDPYKLYQIYP
ncbi:MAG: hypothetical protein IJ848_03225 [Alphaproteobacteria bacterium]|nr:hypothetical protein [Alphaproteobacteria bacterium]